MRFIDTTVFGVRFVPKDAAVTELRAQVEQLAGTLESKNAANIALINEYDVKMHEYLLNKAQGIKSKKPNKPDLMPIVGDGKRYKSLLRHLAEAERRRCEVLSGNDFTHYEIMQMIAEMLGTVWTTEAAMTLNDKRAAHEGRGEKAVRMMRGLPLIVTQEKRDMEDGDVKWLDGGGSVQCPQVGRCGLTAYIKFVWDLAQDTKISKYINPQIIEAITSGELPHTKLEGLPSWLLERIMTYIEPTDILGQYGDIYCAFEFGYVVVPQSDVSDAWTLVGVTKGKPRYSLKRSYSLQKMLELSAMQETKLQPDMAAE